MRTSSLIAPLLASFSLIALAQEKGVGYDSVEKALAALKAKPGVTVSMQGDWTIISDDGGNTVWSFAPQSHPAHPAAVKRSLVADKDGNVRIQTGALCQASKANCDALMEEFKALNDKAAKAVQARTSQSGSAGTVVKDAQVEAETLRYFALRDAGKLEEAHALHSVEQQTRLPFPKWREIVQGFNTTAGAVTSREVKRITLYRNPAGLPQGDYFAVDFSGVFASAPVHCGYLVWNVLPSGERRITREEENFIDAQTYTKLSASKVAEVKQQFRC
ncbi:MAG: DUF4019 domain-containing protein [Burkholderiales bacterium]|nr:DUF4019 domain-containing protein [Burkholderiales bacterium]